MQVRGLTGGAFSIRPLTGGDHIKKNYHLPLHLPWPLHLGTKPKTANGLERERTIEDTQMCHPV